MSSENGSGKQLIPAVLDGDMILVLVGGHKIGFRVRDRLLVCPSCGNLSRPPSDRCYGCDDSLLTDPFRLRI
jgi:hypothetical protein